MGSTEDPASGKLALFSLEGKVALVTGSGRGIGASMAVELARCGARVVVNYANSAGPASEVVKEIQRLGSDAIAIQADVSKVTEIRRLFEEAKKPFGQLDIVCSNAGVVSFGHLEDVTEVRTLCARGATHLLNGEVGRIRSGVQYKHSWPVLRRSRGIQESSRGRPYHLDEFQYSQQFHSTQTQSLQCLQSCCEHLREVPSQGCREEENYCQRGGTGRHRNRHVPRNREGLPTTCGAYDKGADFERESSSFACCSQGVIADAWGRLWRAYHL